MTLQEIKPKQLRALLLLLVLVPFIPMVLMLRFMADALDGERNAERERMATIHQQTLMNAGTAWEKQATTKGAEEMRRFFQQFFDSSINIRLLEAGRPIAGEPARPAGKLLSRHQMKTPEGSKEVQAWLVDESALNNAVRDQFHIYAWTALISAVAICAIAAAAGLAVSRQLALHELKNTSIATVAHELRTPLATMRVLVETLREGRYRTAEQLQEYLEMLHGENLRLSRLTEHFLTHSRLERNQHAFRFAPVAIRSVIDQAIGALRSKLESPGCQLTLDLAEPLPEIVADRDSLVTILLNLLDNAVKYTGEEKRLVLRARREAETMILIVEDNGVGLSSRERKRIFEPYYQIDQKLSRTQEGCGLGLSIVQAIVAAHRGRIDVESQPGRGTAFAVTMPLLPA